MYQEYFNEDHRIFRDSVGRFVEKEIKPNIEEWEEQELFPLELYKKAADAGFQGLEYPEEYGGTPCDKFMMIAYIEEFVRSSGSTGLLSGLSSHTIAMPPVLNLGTAEQKQRFLVPVLRGEKVAALGITEPNAGSDVANIRTRAVRDGDGYRVNGSKTFITSGTRANFLTTAVRTGGPGHKGVSLLVIDSATPGFTVAKKISKMGWHSSDTAELSFEDCSVPVENLLGAEGDGFRGIMINFQNERLSLAVQAHATAQLALEESIKYAKTREAFGTTLSGFQVIRHKLVDMATKVEASKEFNYRVAARMEAGMDVTKEVSMAKNFACEICDKVVFDAVQIHGGYGYAREYVVERLYRDSRILSIGGGTTEIMKEIISKIM
ncbi:MAG: acyl-CoA dehydrogenase [Deltaproteobacteria bacterium HGW-Deltaproteobacteria-12]|jgi:acyl-CoA dehydrogenase|nr:MAG: acyl-CoA dehydrogenase [Deltaproteobacteria bacterium HGW-Deltaproteobacteria-12]